MFTRNVNYWISWADLTFMLFIAGLAAAAISEQNRLQTQRDLESARDELAVLRKTSNPCADAGPFLTGFSSCVASATGRKQLQQSGCFVTVGEDVIRFRNGEAVALDESAADAVAGCLYTHAMQFASADRRSFDAITIHIDGHTDCVGTPAKNETLGAERAMSVYSRVLARAEHDDAWRNAGARRTFLSRIAVRSFGETRPSEDSQCTQKDGWAGDRRVVVSVQLATERPQHAGGAS